jgi:repressor LexA
MILTKMQKRIYDFIVSFLAENGYAPSIVEIGEHFGLSSPATVHKHLVNLESKGLINRQKNLSRAIELPTSELGFRRSIDVPLKGLIAAGAAIEVFPSEDETISIPEDMLGRNRTYVLKVKGDSMIEDQICDGDFVIIDERTHANNGETVVALVNNDSVTLKKYYRENGNVRLQPANSTMEPIVIPAGNVAVQGVVIGLLRKF